MDVAINLALAVGWKTAVQPSNNIPVYNCTTGGVNPVTWGYFETVGMEMTRRFPMENILWYPGGSYKENKMVNTLCEVTVSLNFYTVKIAIFLQFAVFLTCRCSNTHSPPTCVTPSSG